MSSHISIPAPVKNFFSLFPLYRYPANLPPPTPLTTTRSVTLLIAPPLQAHLPSADPLRLQPGASHLSADVESLRWQAYIALRGVRGVRVSWAAGGEEVPKLVLPAGSKRHLGVDVDSLNESLESESLGNNMNEKQEEEGEKAAGVESLFGYEVLDPVRIPMWVDTVQGRSVDVLEGFIDAGARDESRAWSVLLEGVVRSVLVC